MWKIIQMEISSGVIEYQVSDGDCGERSISYDFDNFIEAEKFCNELNVGEKNET
jgi:hypothetical protein